MAFSIRPHATLNSFTYNRSKLVKHFHINSKSSFRASVTDIDKQISSSTSCCLFKCWYLSSWSEIVSKLVLQQNIKLMATIWPSVCSQHNGFCSWDALQMHLCHNLREKHKTAGLIYYLHATQKHMIKLGKSTFHMTFYDARNMLIVCLHFTHNCWSIEFWY